MNWLSINDIKFGIKRRMYEIKHNAEGKTLIYNAQTGDYVGHFDEDNERFTQSKSYQQSTIEIEMFDNGERPASNSKYNLF